VDGLTFISSDHIRIVRALREPIRRITKRDLFAIFEQLFYKSSFRGVPSEQGLSSMYWRKRKPIGKGADPERDRCGLIWCNPVVPFRGADVVDALAIIRRVIQSHRFEPSLGLNCFDERCIDLTTAIVYDRETPGEDQRAMACHDELIGKLQAAGFLPYRLGIHSMAQLPQPSDASRSVLRSLKDALDPRGILAPGRYEPEAGLQWETTGIHRTRPVANEGEVNNGND